MHELTATPEADSEVYRVVGDVCLATGDITCLGSVVVEGDVNAGFHVEAGGDVEIHGSVHGGIVTARGSVTVHLGITQQARVSASGNVRAKFVEYSNVKAGAHVWAADGIVQSTVVAAGKVEALGGHGAIVGGHVAGRLGVSARELGSQRGVPTSIQAGVAPDLRRSLERLREQARDLERQAANHRDHLPELARHIGDGSLSHFGTHQVRTLMAELQTIEARRNQLELRHRALLVTQSAVERAVVEARELCHADVNIRLGSAAHDVRHAQERVRFRRSPRGGYVDVIAMAGAAPTPVPVAG